MALLDWDTLHVQGYFEETKVAAHPCRRFLLSVRLMGSHHALRGSVESVAAGIEDRDRSSGTTLLANVDPTSTGCGWLSARRSGLRLTTTSAANSSQEPLRL